MWSQPPSGNTISHTWHCLHSAVNFSQAWRAWPSVTLRPSSSAPPSESGALLPLAQFGVDLGTNYSRKRLNSVIGLFGVRGLPMTVAYRMRSETTRVCFPGGSDGKKSPLQCRRPRFYPWVGKIPWRKEWLPTPVFLPGEFHGRRCLAAYSPWGHKESDMTKQLSHSLFTMYLHPNSHWIIITLALNYTTYENRRLVRGKAKGKGS